MIIIVLFSLGYVFQIINWLMRRNDLEIKSTLTPGCDTMRAQPQSSHTAYTLLTGISWRNVSWKRY